MSRLYRWTNASVLSALLAVSSPLLSAPDAELEETDTATAETTEVAEQDDVSKALDSTATQWSFQFAWQGTEWKTDEASVNPRPQGHDNFAQLRVVAPFVFDNFTLLPRLTLRHYENLNTGKSGLGNTELFGLIIPKKWDWAAAAWVSAP